MITLNSLISPKKPKVALNAQTLNLARGFVLRKWQERAGEFGLDKPEDLSKSCKFSSLFVQRVFGGSIEANDLHCFNRINGIVVDLNEFSMDVLSMDQPCVNDIAFRRNPDFHESLESCLPRVNGWVKEFYQIAKEKGYAIIAPKAEIQSPSP